MHDAIRFTSIDYTIGACYVIGLVAPDSLLAKQMGGCGHHQLPYGLNEATGLLVVLVVVYTTGGYGAASPVVDGNQLLVIKTNQGSSVHDSEESYSPAAGW